MNHPLISPCYFSDCFRNTIFVAKWSFTRSDCLKVVRKSSTKCKSNVDDNSASGMPKWCVKEYIVELTPVFDSRKRELNI